MGKKFDKKIRKNLRKSALRMAKGETGNIYELDHILRSLGEKPLLTFDQEPTLNTNDGENTEENS